MMTTEDFPALAHLLAAYYFQDWEDVYGSEDEAPARRFIASESRARLVQLRSDIELFLAREPADTEVDAWLTTLHVGAVPPLAELLTAVRAELVAALSVQSPDR